MSLDIYPFATQDGKAIPLDILSPSYLVRIAFTSAANTAITLPEDTQVAMFLATQAVIVSFDETIAVTSPTWQQASCLYIPKDGIVSSSVQALTIQIRGVAESGDLWIQTIKKWAGLALDRQYVRK